MALNNPYALSFDGVDDRVVIPNFYNTAEMTVMAHVVFAEWPINGWIINKRDNFNDNQWQLYCYDGRLEAGIYSGGTTNIGVVRYEDIVAGQVYNICFVTSGVNGGFLRLFIDGIEVGSTTLVGNMKLGSREIVIGMAGWDRYPFEGGIDNIAIFNKALTWEEIDAYKNKYLQGNEPGLAALYRFDDGSGSIVTDSSPNANHGTIYGATWVPGLVDLEGDEPSQGQKVTGSITFRGQSSMFLSAVKTAVGKITFRGGSFMSLIGLVLRELEGVYQISSSEIISRNQPVLSTDLANYIEVWINPRVPAAEAIEVYRSKEPEPIPPGGSKTFSLKLDKEPVIEAIASLEDAGANLSITDTKFYSGSAEITVRNSGATEQTCIIVVQARPLELQGRWKIVVKDEESILDHGLVKYTFDSPLVQDEASARDIGKKILWLFSVARANIEIEWRGDPALELADPVQIPEFEKLGVSKKENFYVTRQLLEVVEGGLDATLSGRKIPRLKEGD